MTKEQIMSLQHQSVFGSNLYKFVEFSSWVNWYPDLFLDLIKPEKGGIKLHTDQRIYLRCIMRFASTYGVFPRGYSKTFNEVLAMFLIAIRYPDIDLSLTAQTKENAAKLLKEKTQEIIKYYPMLENELVGGTFKSGTRFSKNDAEVNFKSGATITILANAQSSKGQRKKRMNIEESALLNNELYEDALQPIVDVPRYTTGKLGIVNPEEMNQQINFFTTSGFRGSDEFGRSIDMLNNMINLNGKMVLGSSWFLACWYGRGLTKSQILEKKKTMSTTAFAQNHESKWVGASDGALVNINKLLSCRNLTTPMICANDDAEYYLGVDVARSESTANNQSSVAVCRVKRDGAGRVSSIELVNTINISNTKNFTDQALEIKRIKKAFDAKMVICDGNGLGSGCVDSLLKECIDPITGENLGCWNTINTDNTPELPILETEQCLFDLKAQGNQTRVVTRFIDSVDSGKLRLLQKRDDNDFSVEERDDYIEKVLPYVQTDFLIEEIANLKLKTLPRGALTVEKIVGKINKDRWSALAYCIYYIMEYEEVLDVRQESQYDSLLKYTYM
jgi:ribonucleoside-diphosphate reductase alpha chain